MLNKHTFVLRLGLLLLVSLVVTGCLGGGAPLIDEGGQIGDGTVAIRNIDYPEQVSVAIGTTAEKVIAEKLPSLVKTCEGQEGFRFECRKCL